MSEYTISSTISLKLGSVPCQERLFISCKYQQAFEAMLLLWIISVISVLFCYAFMHVCLLMPCGHLLGKG